VTHLVHGMGSELVEPDWPALTAAELSFVPGAVITWHSPRPMSAAALVASGGSTVFVKRHHRLVRDGSQLAAEHAFGAYLRAAGQPVPAVLGVYQQGEFWYEVFGLVDGVDGYRDAVSWSPYLFPEHAAAAGAALARLHLAAAGFPGAERPFGPLMSSSSLVTAADPLSALDALMASRPGLARFPSLRSDVAQYVLPLIVRAGPVLRSLAPQWGHGDWHPSNLTWTSRSAAAEVAGVFDLGLANRTSAVHDLAVALERSVFSWLDMPGARFDAAMARALLAGYSSVRPLSAAERAALPLVLPVAHVEYALSEISYFADVVHSAANAGLAYDYLIDHARFFITNGGSCPGIV
jgi:Ser/Thr protein kinase RdoA (MazF antagonist)